MQCGPYCGLCARACLWTARQSGMQITGTRAGTAYLLVGSGVWPIWT